MNKGNFIVYALVHPEDGSIGYVGKTVGLDTRFKIHLKKAQTPKTKVQFWIKSILDSGTLPIVRILKSCASEDESFEEGEELHF